MTRLKVEVISTPLLSFDGRRGAALVVFNDQRKPVKLSVRGAEPEQLTAGPFYSYHLLKMSGDGRLEVASELGENFEFDVRFGRPSLFR
ncbi:MAG: hypothetical protein ACP5UU_06245, partial [Thermoprotei archaeon]